jgi:hypothetical protein
MDVLVVGVGPVSLTIASSGWNRPHSFSPPNGQNTSGLVRIAASASASAVGRGTADGQPQNGEL